MNVLKVLVADSSEEFCRSLTELLRDDFEVQAVHEGKAVLELLNSFSADLLVLDLMLPGMDGITLLHAVREAGRKLKVMATTRFVSDYVTRSAAALGVEYMMLKPCDIRIVSSRLKDLAENAFPKGIRGADSRRTVEELLFQLKVPQKLRGYLCVKEAILLWMKEPNLQITKELYPAVAKICGGCGQQVERVIRCAVETAWKRRDDTVWRRFFHMDDTGSVPKPTNTEFITALAEYALRQSGETL